MQKATISSSSCAGASSAGASSAGASTFTASSSAGSLLRDLPVRNPLAFSRLGEPDRAKVSEPRSVQCTSQLQAHRLSPPRRAVCTPRRLHRHTRSDRAAQRPGCARSPRLPRPEAALAWRPAASPLTRAERDAPVARSHHHGKAEHLAKTVPPTRRGQGDCAPSPRHWPSPPVRPDAGRWKANPGAGIHPL